MRYLMIICLFLTFACNNPSTKKSTAELKSTAEANVTTVAAELTIHGMTCTGCEQTIQSGIKSVNGVKQVKADFKNGKAYVEFLPGIADTSMFREKVTASGYHVTAIKLIPLDSLGSKL